MTGRERRSARNEALFREVNENVRALAFDRDELYDYICECSDVSCTVLLRLSLSEYETARADGTRFVIAPGHEHVKLERVVRHTDRYVLVEKTGDGGEQADSLDPRG